MSGIEALLDMQAMERNESIDFAYRENQYMDKQVELKDCGTCSAGKIYSGGKWVTGHNFEMEYQEVEIRDCLSCKGTGTIEIDVIDHAANDECWCYLNTHKDKAECDMYWNMTPQERDEWDWNKKVNTGLHDMLSNLVTSNVKAAQAYENSK